MWNVKLNFSNPLWNSSHKNRDTWYLINFSDCEFCVNRGTSFWMNLSGSRLYNRDIPEMYPKLAPNYSRNDTQNEPGMSPKNKPQNGSQMSSRNGSFGESPKGKKNYVNPLLFRAAGLPKMISKWSPKRAPKMDPNGSQNDPKINPGMDPKIDPEWSPKWARRKSYMYSRARKRSESMGGEPINLWELDVEFVSWNH